jgi:hypothetical protein
MRSAISDDQLDRSDDSVCVPSSGGLLARVEQALGIEEKLDLLV